MDYLRSMFKCLYTLYWKSIHISIKKYIKQLLCHSIYLWDPFSGMSYICLDLYFCFITCFPIWIMFLESPILFFLFLYIKVSSVTQYQVIINYSDKTGSTVQCPVNILIVKTHQHQAQSDHGILSRFFRTWGFPGYIVLCDIVLCILTRPVVWSQVWQIIDKVVSNM